MVGAAGSEEIRERFAALLEQWRELVAGPEVELSSADRPYLENQPFREMLELGREAAPLILEQLESNLEETHFLVHALPVLLDHEPPAEELLRYAERHGRPVSNQLLARYWIEWWAASEGEPNP